MEDLEEAIAYHREALDLRPPGHPDHSLSLHNLATAVATRFGQLGEMGDLQEAITYNRQALDLFPPGHPGRSKSLNNLANTVADRFRQLGKMEDLEEAIAYRRQALDLRPPGHPDRFSSLNNLATTIATRFEQLGKIEDLEEAIRCHRQAVDLCPPHHPNHASSLDNLASAICARFWQLGKMEDLEEAIAYHRQALDLHPPGHVDRSKSLDNLASAICTRFGHLGKMEDLEEAIAYHRQALALRPPGHPDRSHSLNNLANTVSTRFGQRGMMEDLEEAIAYNRQALDLRPPCHPDRSQSLDNLASAVSTRFGELGMMEDLEDAIVCHRQALKLRPPGHPDRSKSFNNLANAIFIRFGQLGNMEDLEEAIAYQRQALDLRPPGHPDRSKSCNNVANAIFTRFGQLGKLEDLEEAIAYHRQALDLCPPGHLGRSLSLDNLATAVSTRFGQLGKMEDLDEAIAYHRQALDLRLPGHPDRSKSFNNLANAIFTRFGELGRMEDLEEAITYHHQALDLRPPGHPDRSLSLNNLASAIFTRFRQLGKIEDLEEVITHHRQSLNLRPPGHPDRSSSLSNLASAIYTRFDQQGKIDDLVESVKLYFDAETILPSSHARHATTRSMLASTMLELFHHSPSSNCALYMTSDPFALFESAAHHSTSSADARFHAALRWVNAARHFQHSSILHAYSTALACLDRRVTVTPTVQSWHKFLANISTSLALDAASSAIEAGNLETAVELLEQGRAILWSKMQGFRHALDNLRVTHGHLADEFDRVSHELEHHAMSSDIESPPPGFYDTQTQNHRILSEKWDTVVQQIRQINGFQNFLQAVPFASLQLAAAEGPVIVVNISQYRSDAIIIRTSDPPVLVCLPDASPAALHQLSTNLSAALALGRTCWRHMPPILGKLWELIVSPIVDQLATPGFAKQLRIWWCPTGPLCALPLHAAGPYKPKQSNLPDLYISSYTPTLSSLIRARSNAVHRLTSPKLLVMGQPNDHLEKIKLPHVREELHRIQTFGRSVDILVGEQANRETLLACLPQYPWIHFACHGYLTQKGPLLSFFQLHHKDRLTLSDLIKARLSNAELAFLSACHSAAVDVHQTPDEVIHLAAALQFCGFRSVVGTLWSMVDVDGPDVAEDFYKYMFRDPGGIGDFRDSAVALNRATREMRRRRVPMDRWINFVHIGA